MTTTIAVAGKGGTGKTTVCAMLIRYLTRHGLGPVLAIDADPSSNLNMALGLDLEDVTAGGGSDGNTTSQYTATLDGLGPRGDGAHAEREHIVVESLVERTALLTALLAAPLAGEGGA